VRRCHGEPCAGVGSCSADAVAAAASRTPDSCRVTNGYGQRQHQLTISRALFHYPKIHQASVGVWIRAMCHLITFSRFAPFAGSIKFPIKHHSHSRLRPPFVQSRRRGPNADRRCRRRGNPLAINARARSLSVAVFVLIPHLPAGRHSSSRQQSAPSTHPQASKTSLGLV
jgi:hypothetical protein